MEYNEQEAIKYIKNSLTQEVPSDEILNIIDLIWDFYDKKGLLEITFEDYIEDENYELELIEYVKNGIKDSEIKNPVIEQIVLAELDYENTLEDF
ncbi:MAG: hypothetical protein IKJ52_01825 [Muribaculaceae bacterium]|nr:hypothetical protein [Muribaculaceae bacterium]